MNEVGSPHYIKNFQNIKYLPKLSKKELVAVEPP